MIDMNEFGELFKFIEQWKGVFQSHDKDRSGRIDQNELSQGKAGNCAQLAPQQDGPDVELTISDDTACVVHCTTF